TNQQAYQNPRFLLRGFLLLARGFMVVMQYTYFLLAAVLIGFGRYRGIRVVVCVFGIFVGVLCLRGGFASVVCRAALLGFCAHGHRFSPWRATRVRRHLLRFRPGASRTEPHLADCPKNSTSRLSSIRRIIQTRGYSCTDPRPRPFGSGL